MKLVHPAFTQQLQLTPCTACQVVLEPPELFASCVQELYRQIEGAEGQFVLSNGEKELDIAKNVTMVLNPFAVDLQERKIVTKLYHELETLAYSEELYLATRELQLQLQQYFFQLEHSSPYLLTNHAEADFTALLKAMGVQLENTADDFVEQLALYLDIQASLLGKKLAVLVQVSSYLTPAQMQQLQEMAAYRETALLWIENQQKDFSIEHTCYIIDKDYCEI